MCNYCCFCWYWFCAKKSDPKEKSKNPEPIQKQPKKVITEKSSRALKTDEMTTNDKSPTPELKNQNKLSDETKSDKDNNQKSPEKTDSNSTQSSPTFISSGDINGSDVLPPAIKARGYSLVKFIGKGQFAQVFEVKLDKKPDKQFVIKRFKLDELNTEWKEKCLKNEMKIMKKLSEHENIIRGIEYFKTRHLAFIVMDFAKNGSIGELLEKSKKGFEESKVKSWSKDILSALLYIHNSGIAHRDLKPDNFLLRSDDKALLSDFGFACFTVDRGSVRIMKGTQCGSAQYMAPEVHSLKDGHVYNAKAADLYSMGVSIFEMFNYDLPFGGDIFLGDKEHIKKQINREYRLDKKVEQKLSKNAKNLIHLLLEPDPEKRITAKKAFEDDFFIST